MPMAGVVLYSERLRGSATGCGGFLGLFTHCRRTLIVSAGNVSAERSSNPKLLCPLQEQPTVSRNTTMATAFDLAGPRAQARGHAEQLAAQVATSCGRSSQALVRVCDVRFRQTLFKVLCHVAVCVMRRSSAQPLQTLLCFVCLSRHGRSRRPQCPEEKYGVEERHCRDTLSAGNQRELTMHGILF